MKVSSVLNNYQVGSYSYHCLSNYIIEEVRLDRYHTRVTWEIENQSQFRLLSKALGSEKRIKILEA